MRKEKKVKVQGHPRGARRHPRALRARPRTSRSWTRSSSPTTAPTSTRSTGTRPRACCACGWTRTTSRRSQDYALRQGIETIRGRVDKFGVAEPSIRAKGRDIIVELPGLTKKHFERVKKIIGRTAQLEFKIVDDAQQLHGEGGGQGAQGRRPIEVRTDSYDGKKSGQRQLHLPAVQGQEGPATTSSTACPAWAPGPQGPTRSCYGRGAGQGREGQRPARQESGSPTTSSAAPSSPVSTSPTPRCSGTSAPAAPRSA